MMNGLCIQILCNLIYNPDGLTICSNSYVFYPLLLKDVKILQISLLFRSLSSLLASFQSTHFPFRKICLSYLKIRSHIREISCDCWKNFDFSSTIRLVAIILHFAFGLTDLFIPNRSFYNFQYQSIARLPWIVFTVS